LTKKSKIKISLITLSLTIILLITAFIIFSLPRSIEARLKEYVSKEIKCPREKLNINKLETGFLVKGCNQKIVYVECGCCDTEWFQQCKSPKDKEWLKFCDPEIRQCLGNCLQARKSVGFQDEQSTEDICKEFDQRFSKFE